MESRENDKSKTWMLFLFLGLFVVGLAGYLLLHNYWVRYIFAHTGALGIVGLFGFWAGLVARKKGYSFWKAFLLGFALPTIIGILSVLVVIVRGGEGCGGSVSLAISIVVVIIYYLVKRRNINIQSDK